MLFFINKTGIIIQVNFWDIMIKYDLIKIKKSLWGNINEK